MLMNFYKKIILLIAAGFVCFSSAKGLLSIPFLYPVQKAKQFDETSRYISSLRYSWAVSSYFPDHVQELAGAWYLQFGSGWLHKIPRKSSVTAGSKTTSDKKKIKTFISYYPAVLTAGVHWELNHLHYARPVFGAGYAFYNPLENSVLPRKFVLDKKSYFITAGVLLSFDIVDSNFSHRMSYEYGIQDMGLLIEYQKYYSVKNEGLRHWGISTGLYMAF